VDLQALEQAVSQKTSGCIKPLTRLHRIAGQDAEENLGMRVVGGDLYRTEGDHAHPGILELARNQFRQIALDLIGYTETTMSGRRLLAHEGSRVSPVWS
jgi:hypothetical protein